MVNLKEARTSLRPRERERKDSGRPRSSPTCCHSAGCREAEVLHQYFSSVLGEEPNGKAVSLHDDDKILPTLAVTYGCIKQLLLQLDSF